MRLRGRSIMLALLIRLATATRESGPGPMSKGAAFLSSAAASSPFARRSPSSLLSTGVAPGVTVGDVENPTRESPYFPVYYNDVYEVDLPPGHRFPMGKYRRVREALQAKVGNLSGEERRRVHCEFRVSPLATRQQLLTTHDEDYVRRYLSGDMTESENRNIGFPWSHQHVNRTLSSVGGTVAAACAAWEEYLRRWEQSRETSAQQSTRSERPKILNRQTDHLCWAAHVAGGTHHAFHDYGEGFCIFSDIAVAANVLLERYSPSSLGHHTQQYPNDQGSPTIRRILILDLDVHQGNGNAALFDGRPEVQTFSMHCSANYFSKKERSDLDVELPVGCDDETYLSTLRYWLKRIEEHRFDEEVRSIDKKAATRGGGERKPFDLIFYQAGVDIHEEDRLGRLSVTPAGISRRNALVFEFARKMESPLVISMGGGYPKGNDWTPIIDAHASVYWEAHRYLSKARLKALINSQ
mmetsp:Transcript_42861/g.91116  ORF Transcript_42861/g.91116 Transcript_42861/m.91116 type:complete len:468 (+) Transcript_42861:2-1405(+)